MALFYCKTKYCVLIPTDSDISRGFYHLLDNKVDAEQMAAEVGGLTPFEVVVPVK